MRDQTGRSNALRPDLRIILFISTDNRMNIVDFLTIQDKQLISHVSKCIDKINTHHISLYGCKQELTFSFVKMSSLVEGIYIS